MKKNDKIFVTGGTGFIGSYILRELVTRGYVNIHAIRRKKSDMRLVEPFESHITWHFADLQDIDLIYDLIKGSEIVIHAAGLVSFAPADKDKLYEINVLGTETIVNACLEHNIPKLIHISSIGALAKTRQGQPITEETKWSDDRHISHYGRSKHLGEMEVWRGIAEGQKAVILNPSIVLGAGDWFSSSCRLFMQIHKGLKYYTPGSTGFVDVRDVARIAVSMMDLRVVNQGYIINESNYSFNQIFTWMADGLSTAAPTTKAPKWIAKTIVLLEALKSKISGSKPVITADSVRNAYQDFHYENKKIKSLGFSFTPIEETIQQTTEVLQKASRKDFPPMLLPSLSVAEPNTNQ